MSRSRPTHFHNFLEPDQPPQIVHLRVDPGGLEFRDLMEQWPVKKTLTSRDINYSQVVLPRDQLEDFVFLKLSPEQQYSLNRGHQLLITVRDLETLTEHELKLWENGSSYVLTGGWNSNFVRRRALQVGEEVGFCWDERLQMLRFSVLSRPSGPSPPPPPPLPPPSRPPPPTPPAPVALLPPRPSSG